MKRALLAALVAGAVMAVGLWLLLEVTWPSLVVAGVALISWVVVSEAGLFAGAALGAMSRNRPLPA